MSTLGDCRTCHWPLDGHTVAQAEACARWRYLVKLVSPFAAVWAVLRGRTKAGVP